MKLLLHVCCGPDATVALERLPEYERLCLLFDNPNIHPFDEFQRRREAFEKVVSHRLVESLVGEYDPEAWLKLVEGHEGDPEKGERCNICIRYRMDRTSRTALEARFDTIGSVFTTSPHKPAAEINAWGLQIAAEYGLKYLVSDFKKKDGFKRSVELSRELGLYRQNYCGCIYSMQK